MEWFKIARRVAPHVVKIETPKGHGTGFLCFYSSDQTFCGIATALHVVQEAYDWQLPIRIRHEGTPVPLFVKENERAIWTNAKNDSAVVLVRSGVLSLPKNPLPMFPADQLLMIGVEVAWLGYPSVAPKTLCFFNGNISAQVTDAYLIDGVAIHGVSGGPVFRMHGRRLMMIGAISAYLPNRIAGDALPGLSFAQDMTYFHDSLKTIRSLDEARQKEQDQKQKQSSEQPSLLDGTEPTQPSSA